MTEQFLHGVEVIELDYGARPISTVRSSVIGLIGTAPEARARTAATLHTGALSADDALRYTAVVAGKSGNDISVRYRHPGVPDAPLTVTVTGKAIVVALATDSGGFVESSAIDVLTAINDTCLVPSDSIPIRSWPLFQAEGMMRLMLESLQSQESNQ